MRRLAWLAALPLVTSGFLVLTPQPAAAATPFTDLAGSEFTADIEWAHNTGITVGCDTRRFCPDASVSREQMASFLARMFDLPATTTDYFADDETSGHEGAINRVAAAGITAGCRAGAYCPDALVTREQMASFVARAAELVEGSGRNYFWDDNSSSHEGAIDRFAAAGITTGCAAYRFCPADEVTREQMTAFLHRVVAPQSAPPYPAPAPPTPTPPPGGAGGSGCHPSYIGYCLGVNIGDWDCAGGSGNGPNYVPVTVRVVGPDVYGLDGDGDGYGCE